jgi:hypothetical protein
LPPIVAPQGPQRDWKYCWSDFPATTPLAVLVEYAHRRHWVEQHYEEAQTQWLRRAAIRELIELGLIDWYCSRHL